MGLVLETFIKFGATTRRFGSASFAFLIEWPGIFVTIAWKKSRQVMSKLSHTDKCNAHQGMLSVIDTNEAS